MRTFLKLAVLAALAGAAIYSGSLALYAFSAWRPGTSETFLMLIRKGQAPAEIARELETTGVIGDRQKFLQIGRIMRKWPLIKAGEYKVSGAMSPVEVLSVLTSGVSVAHPLTIREGENMYEIATEIEAQRLAKRGAFLSLCKDPAFIRSLNLDIPAGPHQSLEGYLFPDTYHFNVSMTAEDMIRQMVKRFTSVWSPDHAARTRELGFTRHQLVILASMVEKETGAPHERGKISSVFHNRLKKRMKLQSDPTTIYGMWERYKGNIRRADLLTASPFNTYVVPGLPAGPISNPGREAIGAALHPDPTDFLYFVSQNDGTSQFSSTLEAHNRAVRRFQVDPSGRSGKSWRNLNKTSN
jgi:UPF0755 protein